MFSFGVRLYKNACRVLSMHIHMLTTIDYILLGLCGVVTGSLFYYKRKDYKKVVAVGILFSYLLLLLEWNVLKRSTFDTFKIAKPFWSYSAILQGNRSVLYQVLMNCFMLIPVGFLLAYIDDKLKFRQILLLGISISVTQELLQLIFKKGEAEIDDILHNAVGMAAGYVLFKIVTVIKRTSERDLF